MSLTVRWPHLASGLEKRGLMRVMKELPEILVGISDGV
jgi:hypothetical protein